VGAKRFEGAEPIFEQIRRVGEEYGATTGRPRQCNWMDWQLLERAININGVTDLIINKVDVLDEIGQWSLYDEGSKKEFRSSIDMQQWISDKIKVLGVKNINFSGNKERI